MLSMRPFGGGHSICSDRFFASNEILGGLALILDQLDVEIDEARLKRNGWPKPDVKCQGGLLPDRGLTRLRWRKGREPKV
jgi:hypothetical protein